MASREAVRDLYAAILDRLDCATAEARAIVPSIPEADGGIQERQRYADMGYALSLIAASLQLVTQPIVSDDSVIRSTAALRSYIAKAQARTAAAPSPFVQRFVGCSAGCGRAALDGKATCGDVRCGSSTGRG